MCQRCQELEAELELARDELLSMGRDVQVQTVDDNDLERHFARWVSSPHESDAAAGFRAGWRAMSQLATPRLREWQQLVFGVNREGDRLRARLGNLLREQSRQSDSG